MTDVQPRDVTGQFAATAHTAPELTIPAGPDVNGFEATIEDFLHGSAASFGFNVSADDIETAAHAAVIELFAGHQI